MKKLLIALLCLLSAFPCAARTITVDDDGPADFNTIQAAIDEGNDGDVLIVQPGTYTADGNRDIDFLGKTITVRSTDPNDPNIVVATVIDCNGSQDDPHRGFYFHSQENADSIVDGFTVRNGYAPSETFHVGDNSWAVAVGGAVYCDGASPTIVNCVIEDNSAVDGGGICCGHFCSSKGSSPTIRNCTITNNCAEAGGGIYCGRGKCWVVGCIVRENSAISGGGIANARGEPQIVNCIISDNTAEHWGGGFNGWYAGPYDDHRTFISGCVVARNWAESGGALRTLTGAITNSLILGNFAESSGGGIDYSKCSISSCIISGNTSAGFGGAIHHSEGLFRNSNIIGNRASWSGGGLHACEADIINCIFTDNTEHAIVETWYAKRPYVIFCLFENNTDGDWYVYDTQTTLTGADAINSLYYVQENIDGDPGFICPGFWADADDSNTPLDPDDPNAVWVDGDYHLLPDSNCINAGEPDYIYEPNETDIDGQPRVWAGRVDIGADEFVPPAECQMHLTPQSLNVRSKARYLNAHLVLPDGIAAEHVDVNRPGLIQPFGIESLAIEVSGGGDRVKVKMTFDRAAVCTAGDFDGIVKVEGFLTTGRTYYGTDTIRLVK